MKLIYSQNSGQITNATGAWQITAAPELGFAYDGIFVDENGNGIKYVGDGRIDLTDDELVAAIKYTNAAIMPTPAPLTADEITLLNRANLQPLSAWQIRKALSQFGLRDAVEQAMSAAPIDLQDSWHYASQFKRDDDVLLGAALALGLTDAQVDAMFEAGATL